MNNIKNLKKIAANASENASVSELNADNLSKPSVYAAPASEEALIWAPFSGLSVLCFRFSLVFFFFFFFFYIYIYIYIYYLRVFELKYSFFSCSLAFSCLTVSLSGFSSLSNLS